MHQFLNDSTYHEAFKSCGTNVRIAPDVLIEHPECFEVGNDVTIHSGVFIGGRPKQASIGDGVSLCSRVHISGSPSRFLLGEKVRLYTGVVIEGGGLRPESAVEIGPHSHCAPYAVLYGAGGLRLGSHCNVSAHVVFATVGHDYRDTTKPMANFPYTWGPITVEDDVWIAANSTICAGVTISRGCVIGGNSIVTHSTEPMGIYGGTPARFLRSRTGEFPAA